MIKVYEVSYYKSSAVAEMGDRASEKWAEKWGLPCPFPWGSCVPIQHNVAWAEAHLYTKWHRNPSNRLTTIHQRHRYTGQTTVR